MANTPWQRLDDDDGIIIDGVEYRVQASSASGQKLRETARPSVTANFSHEQWRHIQHQPGFRHIPHQHSPLRAEIRSKVGVEFTSDIPKKELARMRYYEDLVLELIAKHAAGGFTLKPAEVQWQIDNNGLGAEADEKMRQRQLRTTGGLGGTAYGLFKRPSGSVLLEKRRLYLKFGLEGLRDQRFRSGTGSQLQLEVAAIMAMHVAKFCINPSATKTSVHTDIADDIDERNERLLLQHLESGDPSTPLTVLRKPDWKTVSRAIDDIDPFYLAVGRFGVTVAVQKYPAVRGTPDRLGPMSRIEYDESPVDLLNLMVETGVWNTLTPEQKAAVPKGRMMMGTAICVATRCIVAMRIYPVGSGETTALTLAMCMQDKTHFLGDLVRHGLTWHQYGGVRQIVMDQGGTNIADVTRTAIANLGCEVLYGPASDPKNRGVGERIFRTYAPRIYALMHDRTGSNEIERKRYMPEDTARLTIDELCKVMVVGVAGIYHNSPHRELGDRTPAGEWERMIPDYGVPSLPDPNRWRVTFGLHRFRKVTRYGINHCGQSYTNARIDHHYLHGHGELEIACDLDDLGAISVRIGTEWDEATCIDPDMRGVSVKTLLAASQAQKHIADDDAKKRNAARRAAKKFILETQERAGSRLNTDPSDDDHVGRPQITLEMIEAGEKQIFGKYQHAEDDMPVSNGLLGFEVAPDNTDPTLPDTSSPKTPNSAPAVPKTAGKKSRWGTR